MTSIFHTRPTPVPCCDSATAASPVIRARGVAPLTAKTIGLPRPSMMSTVAPTARRSCGLGRVGMTTRSAWPTTALIVSATAGGVSMKTSLVPCARSFLEVFLHVRERGLDECRAYRRRARSTSRRGCPAGRCRSARQGRRRRGRPRRRAGHTASSLPEPPFCEAKTMTRIGCRRLSSGVSSLVVLAASRSEPKRLELGVGS